jgi:hypothetical protein
MLSLTPIPAASRNATIAEAADAYFRPMSRESGNQNTAQDRPADRARGGRDLAVTGSSSMRVKFDRGITKFGHRLVIGRWCIGVHWSYCGSDHGLLVAVPMLWERGFTCVDYIDDSGSCLPFAGEHNFDAGERTSSSKPKPFIIFQVA